jgi:predicted lipoprotein with Yx(FWY)xxD motif
VKSWLIVVVVLLAGGCTSQATDTEAGERTRDRTTTPSEASTSSSTTKKSHPPASKSSDEPGARIITADSDYGTMLFDDAGQPIYLFTAESDDQARCHGECAEDWPPVLTSGSPSVDGAARASLLDTVRRPGGGTQVTYAGHPLYFYAHEGKYEVLCHNVEEYGGTWLVVRPDGTAAPG